MKVGDLVRNTKTDEIYIVTSTDADDLDWTYVEVSSRWAMPKEHLEVISESR